MAQIPLIGLSGRRTRGHRQEGYAPELHHLDLDLYFADYARAIIEAGGLPVHLPLDVDPALAIRRLDAILLSGGADIDSVRFDAPRDPAVSVVEPERDAFEFALLGEALRHELPVLGICRGLQLINVHFGGTLHQHVPEHSNYAVGTNGVAHPVTIDDGSILDSLYGSTVDVNSLHHQTVDEVGSGLKVSARAPDGTVEGLEAGDHVLAVQWHPEMMDGRSTDPVFRWIVERAGG